LSKAKTGANATVLCGLTDMPHRIDSQSSKAIYLYGSDEYLMLTMSKYRNESALRGILHSLDGHFYSKKVYLYLTIVKFYQIF